ncbi:MAG TPA: hypothetical protein VNX21_08140 [Candidatus Thermoplasmatota archaeon]|nr:hypothetical protein [Candidatus Thermoplasmatota archaeon]
MRTLAFLLGLALLTTAAVVATPAASAACDPLDVDGAVRCVVDFLLMQDCIVNPLWHVDPDQPRYMCWA